MIFQDSLRRSILVASRDVTDHLRQDADERVKVLDQSVSRRCFLDSSFPQPRSEKKELLP